VITPRRRGPDEGLTLIELVIAMSITSTLLLGIGWITMSTIRADRTMNVRISASADARLAMEAVSRTLRTAVKPTGETAAVTVATPTAVSFYTLIQRDGTFNTPLPTLVEYYQDSTTGCLIEAKTPARTLTVPVGNSIYAWDTGRTTKCLVRTASVPSLANPWFTYYTSGSGTTPITLTLLGLSLFDRQTVQSVAFTPTVVDPDNPTVPGVQDAVRVTLANVALAQGNAA
jgi:type II secretory pathway component PulJ